MTETEHPAAIHLPPELIEGSQIAYSHVAIKDDTVFLSKKPFIFEGVHSTPIKKVVRLDLNKHE